MKYIVLVVGLLLVSIEICNCLYEVDYYVKLIQRNIEKAESYISPTYYSGFELVDEAREPVDLGTYDFIIIGGGTAGSVLATRLSEENDWKILLIEGGYRGNDFTDIPFLYNYLANSDYNWGINTTSQKVGCRAYPNNACTYPSGKGLGGSSLINGLVFARGTRSDYDNWEAQGLKGWSYEDVLPYFKKIENASALVDIDKDYRGFKGPLTIENNDCFVPVVAALIAALKEHGLSETDYNGKHYEGFGLLQKTTIGGRRNYAASAYLRLAERRTNLEIILESLVTKILFEKKNATAVIFTQNGTKYVAYIGKEIILSAGSVGSPRLLMLSGVGSSEELLKLNIPLVNDLPVGKVFHDQVYTYLTVTTNYSYSEDLRAAVVAYLKHSGVLTKPSGVDLIGFYENNGRPVEFIYRNAIELDTRETELAISIVFVLMHPLSKGSLTLPSSDPLDFPLIDPDCLTAREDVEALIDALDFFANVLESEQLKSFNVSIVEDTANCGNFTFKSREYWECFVTYTANPSWHGVGSCKMGVTSEESVVDEKLRVHGLGRIRVVDASVAPSPVTGHTAGMVYMIAEKASDMIKSDHLEGQGI